MTETAPPPTATVAEPAQPTAGEARSGGHLWQVDVVRLLTFAAVISVHVFAFTERPDNRAVAGAMMILQFGREVFFALTGFVLIYSTMGKPMRVLSFWRKRILYVAVPYVVWSLLYYLYDVYGPHHPQELSLKVLLNDLADGGSEYHLYFLLVTLQMYLLFPLIRAFVTRTAHRAWRVLGVVGAFNLAWYGALQWAPVPAGGPGRWFFNHAYEILPTYAMYVLAGCYAAVHLPRMQQILDRYPRRLLAATVLCTAGALTAYALQISPTVPPRVANDVLQPASLLDCIGAAIVVYLIGSRWAAGPRRYSRTVEILSDASFGVYLAHPMVLQFLLDYCDFGSGEQAMPPAIATVGAYVITITGATAISLLARRTPLSLPLAGRPWRSPVKSRTATRREPPPDDQPRSEALALC